MSYERLPFSVIESYPKVDEVKVHERFVQELSDFHRKIVVLDDDPTGVQTVHDISVYTDWEEESLLRGMQEEGNMFFVLTNSRSFTKEETAREHMLLAERTVKAAKQCSKEVLFLSRGDSTLRGHYPLEPEVIKEALENSLNVRMSGQVLCPYFKEGGRYTINSIHYVKEGEFLIPAGGTEFAADKTFGYSASHLGEYAEEKSYGIYTKEKSIYITLPMLRAEEYEEITKLLLGAEGFQPIIVDAVSEADVEIFATCLLRAIKQGKEFVIRCAAAVPKVLGNVSNKPLLSGEELVEGSSYGGIIIIGSHVKKTSLQLEELQRTEAPTAFLEFQVNTCLQEGGLERETQRMITLAEEAMAEGKTAVVYTSRKLLAPEGMSGEEMLKLSVRISDALTGVVSGLNKKPGFIVAKGGITSSDVGTKALQVKKALVLGQVKPGIPVWKTGEESKFPGLSYLIFPGNVGEISTLREIVELCSQRIS